MYDHSVEYYDITLFNADTLDVPVDFPVIAEMYFRLDLDSLKHERSVYQVMDLLGDVGGVSDILMSVAFFLCGGYVTFHASVETMKELYSCEHDHKKGLDVMLKENKEEATPKNY